MEHQNNKTIFFAGTLALSAEKRLIKDLVETYKQAGVIGRPVKNTSEAILVHFGLALIQILNLDEKNQVLTISTWSRYVSSHMLYFFCRILTTVKALQKLVYCVFDSTFPCRACH